MEIKAKEETTYKVIKLTKEYKTLAILYLILAIISMAIFFAISDKLTFIVMFAISFFCMIYNFYNYNQFIDDTYELKDCKIKLSSNYLEFKQLVNAKYQTGRIFLPEIDRIMKVEDGFQIWFDKDSGNNLYMIDDDIIKADTVCINYFAYDTEEYVNLYLNVLNQLPDTAEKILDTTEWKDSSDISNWFKMMLPACLYIIPCVLNIIM